MIETLKRLLREFIQSRYAREDDILYRTAKGLLKRLDTIQ